MSYTGSGYEEPGRTSPPKDISSTPTGLPDRPTPLHDHRHESDMRDYQPRSQVLSPTLGTRPERLPDLSGERRQFKYFFFSRYLLRRRVSVIDFLEFFKHK